MDGPLNGGHTLSAAVKKRPSLTERARWWRGGGEENVCVALRTTLWSITAKLRNITKIRL